MTASGPRLSNTTAVSDMALLLFCGQLAVAGEAGGERGRDGERGRRTASLSALGGRLRFSLPAGQARAVLDVREQLQSLLRSKIQVCVCVVVCVCGGGAFLDVHEQLQSMLRSKIQVCVCVCVCVWGGGELGGGAGRGAGSSCLPHLMCRPGEGSR